MRAVLLFLVFSMIAKIALAAEWKYESAKCDNAKMTSMLTKKSNEIHSLKIYPEQKIIEFRTVIKGDKNKTERFFYRYTKKSQSVVELQKVDVVLSQFKTEIESYADIKEQKPFRYRMLIDIDTLQLESKMNDDGMVVNCSTTYNLSR